MKLKGFMTVYALTLKKDTYDLVIKVLHEELHLLYTIDHTLREINQKAPDGVDLIGCIVHIMFKHPINLTDLEFRVNRIETHIEKSLSNLHGNCYGCTLQSFSLLPKEQNKLNIKLNYIN